MKKTSRILLLPFFIFSLLVVALLLIRNFTVNINSSNESTPLSDNSITYECKRNTRIASNLPKYDRALSLIAERMEMWNNSISDNAFFPSSLVNCIKIEESETLDNFGAEGLFIFDENLVEPNVYTIYVDWRYGGYDDLTTAMLLVHEVTHVQQYIDELNNEKRMTCIEQEAQAFYSQISLRTQLNQDELNSIESRIGNEKYTNPQLQILDTLLQVRDNYIIEEGKKGTLFGCMNTDGPCDNRTLQDAILEYLIDSRIYDEQCKL